MEYRRGEQPAPLEQLYTNNTQPYFRAPHVYIGFPCRFVPGRKKLPTHAEDGMNDGVLMSSRDGLNFERWMQAFLRPGPDPLRASWQVPPSGGSTWVSPVACWLP